MSTAVELAPATGLDLVLQLSDAEQETKLSLKNSFQAFYAQAQEWKDKASGIKVTSAAQTAEMKLARDSRLALRRIRIDVENTRKRLKEDSLRRSQAIDSVAKALKDLIEPTENYLLEQEEFAAREETARKEALEKDRGAKLAAYGIVMTGLVDMSEAQFELLLAGTKQAYETKLENERKAETDRIAKEKADAEERERVKAENERLKKEAAEREAQAKAERQRLLAEQAKKDDERRVAEEAARKQQAALQAKLEEEKHLNDLAAKKAKEADEALRKEKEARQQAEQQAAELRRIEQEKIAREAAERKRAAAAPDREKLLLFAEAIRALLVPQGLASSNQLREQTDKFAMWVAGLAAKLADFNVS